MTLKILKPASPFDGLSTMHVLLEKAGQEQKFTLLPYKNTSLLFVRDAGSDLDKIRRRFRPPMEFDAHCFSTGIQAGEVESILLTMFEGLQVVVE